MAEIQKFPCEDLKTIDQLWVKYSKGRFGFSIQKQIWQEVGGKPNADDLIWCSFGERVGWRVKGDWLWSDNLTFTLNAPKGHLPGFGVKKGWWLSWSVLGGWELFSRIEACKV